MARQKFQLEFALGKVASVQLWTMLSTGGGLSRWIEANLSVEDDIATFSWSGGGSDKAQMFVNVSDRKVSFDWLEDEGGFTLSLITSELTKELSLLIEDECEEEDYESNCQIWHRQVSTLQHVLGLPQ